MEPGPDRRCSNQSAAGRMDRQYDGKTLLRCWLQSRPAALTKLDKAVEQAASCDPQACLLIAAERRGAHHRPGLCPHHRRCQPFSALQPGSQLSGTDPCRAYLLQQATTGSASASRATAFSGCYWSKRRQSVTRLDPQFHKHYVHLCRNKHKAVAKVAAARKLAVRLYWVLTHRTRSPESRTHREPLAGAPGQRKPDRNID